MARLPLFSSAGTAVVALALIACGTSSDGAEPVSAAPPDAPELYFQRDGIPGPWWRSGASQEMFDAEHRVCLARSHEARRTASENDAAEAAYRSFLDCMQRASWNRGLPPRA